MDATLQKIKQPEPSVGTSEKKGENIQQKIIPARNIGIVPVPKISKTPLRDMVEIRRQENPHITYKITEKNTKLFSIHTLTTIAVLLCGALSFKIFKK